MTIAESWLSEVGFKWHQFDRQPYKNWLLWLGPAIEDKNTAFEDLGIELAPSWWQNRNGEDVGNVGAWHCWLRADTSGRYSRFLHVRPLRHQRELIQMIEGLTGQTWDPRNNLVGAMHHPKRAESIRSEFNRFDIRVMESRPWRSVEDDDTRGRALPEHMEHHANTVEGGQEC